MAINLFVFVPGGFKLERGPTFVLACDALGVRWLGDRFLGLAMAGSGVSFTIGDGDPISSDNKCSIVVRKAAGDAGGDEISHSGKSRFSWAVSSSYANGAASQLFSLADSKVPAHQYLNIERGRYRTVVVTKDEYPLDTLRSMRDSGR